jgi:hypothetical protein
VGEEGCPGPVKEGRNDSPPLSSVENYQVSIILKQCVFELAPVAHAGNPSSPNGPGDRLVILAER